MLLNICDVFDVYDVCVIRDIFDISTSGLFIVHCYGCRAIKLSSISRFVVLLELVATLLHLTFSDYH